MRVLVTRPQPDADRTVAALAAGGIDALAAPMLRFTPMGLPDEPDAAYSAVIVTSANALRALEHKALLSHLVDLPIYAVGERTAEAAAMTGFSHIFVGEGDAKALARAVGDAVSGAGPLLYLAGADLAHDLAGALGERGLSVVTLTTYRMSPVPHLPAGAVSAIADGRIDAVLHYSRRSARAFLAAAREDGVETTALALVHVCLSDAVGMVLRDAGGARVAVAAKPDEAALIAALRRALPARVK